MDRVYYIAAYFSTLPDLHRKQRVAKDDFGYIRDYYHSIDKLGLHCFILVDDVSDEFVEKYQTEKIHFVRVEISTREQTMHPHDLRFIKMREFIQSRPEIQYVALTDICDVTVTRDCYELTRQTPGKVICSFENDNIYENQWYGNYLRRMAEQHEIDHTCSSGVYDGCVILNCGVMCGTRDPILEFLREFDSRLTMFENPAKPLDMFLVNWILHKCCPHLLATHPKLTTPFAHNRRDQSCYFKHK